MLPWLKIFSETISQTQNLPSILASYGVNVYHLSSMVERSFDVSVPYQREILFKNHQIEVMLAIWSYRSTTSPHNHGTSNGIIWLTEGNFFEQNYQFQNGILTKINEPVKLLENQIITIEPNDIHSCWPEYTGLSLHIYSPPIQNMKVWDEARKKTLTVADDCGAWVPKNRNLILSEAAW